MTDWERDLYRAAAGLVMGPAMPEDKDKTEEDWEREERIAAFNQEAFNQYNALASDHLRATMGERLTSRDIHKWSQGFATAVAAIRVLRDRGLKPLVETGTGSIAVGDESPGSASAEIAHPSPPTGDDNV